MNLQVGVKVLIKNDSNEYLLMRRTKTMPGKTEPHWDIPGGRIEPHEPLLQALDREILEETGLTLTETPALLTAQDIFVEKADLHVVRLTYVTSLPRLDITMSDEHQETKWATKEEAETMDLDPYLRDALQRLN